MDQSEPTDMAYFELEGNAKAVVTPKTGVFGPLNQNGLKIDYGSNEKASPGMTFFFWTLMIPIHPLVMAEPEWLSQKFHHSF